MGDTIPIFLLILKIGIVSPIISQLNLAKALLKGVREIKGN
jgi:hypothetical protein